jgi:hypothetical protein
MVAGRLSKLSLGKKLEDFIEGKSLKNNES